MVAACGGSDRGAGGPLSDSVYVEVMARLVLLDPDMTSESEVPLRGLPRDTARRRVLDRYGVEADQLLAFAEAEGRSPATMAELWQRIQELSDSLRDDGWRPPGDEEADRPDAAEPTESGGAP